MKLKDLKKLISEDKLKEVLTYLKEICSKNKSFKSYSDEVVMLARAFKKLNKNTRLNLIENSESSRERAIISDSLLHLINEMFEEKDEKNKKKIKENKFEKQALAIT